MYTQYKIIFLLLAISINATAQKDTIPLKDQTIRVKSSFKPVLRNAVKQSFYATPPFIDTTKPTLSYTVPAQNLFFSYQPVALKPLALQVNTNYGWENSNYIKLGYGNFQTPYLSAGFSFGNGRSTALGLYADFISSKGNIKYQDYSKIALAAQGSKSTDKGFEFKGKIGYNQDEYNLYGYNQNLFNFTKDNVRQRFQTITLNAGFRNTMPSEYGITYNPTLQSSIFTDNRNASETNIALDLPIQKFIGKSFGIKLGAAVDLTSYKKPGTSISNTIFYVKPALLYKSINFSINAGVTPAWENGKLSILPDLTADVQVQGSKYVLQLGWLGYFNKGSYQRWAGINPYLAQPEALPNTKVDEIFAGFKGTSGNHIVYAAKIGYFGYRNMPFFVNDTVSGKSFDVVNESDFRAVQIHGEIGVIEKEIFHLTAGVNVNNFIRYKDNLKAWGMLPLELTGALRWQLFKGLWVKADAFIWDGASFRTKTGQVDKLNLVADINAGIEFKVAKQFNVWFQANNLTNSKYQRWRQYENYGLNILGGVKYSFVTKPSLAKPAAKGL
jgi:hypothetical protein